MPALSVPCEKDNPQITDASKAMGCPLQITQDEMFNESSPKRQMFFNPITKAITDIKTWLEGSARQKILGSVGAPTFFVLVRAEKPRTQTECDYRISKAHTSSERQCIQLILKK